MENRKIGEIVLRDELSRIKTDEYDLMLRDIRLLNSEDELEFYKLRPLLYHEHATKKSSLAMISRGLTDFIRNKF